MEARPRHKGVHDQQTLRRSFLQAGVLFFSSFPQQVPAMPGLRVGLFLPKGCSVLGLGEEACSSQVDGLGGMHKALASSFSTTEEKRVRVLVTSVDQRIRDG